MTEFKVGDTVQLKPESEWNNGSPLNPIDTDGEVTYIYPEAGLPIEVSWSDQGINDYNASSLFLVRSSECSEGDQGEDTSTNPFNNTYIYTKHFSPDKIQSIAEKYSKALGIPLEGYLQEECDSEWNYLGAVVKMGSEGYISVEDRITLFPHNDLTEITEEDLDNYLNSTSTTTTKYVEDWDALEVGQKATFRGFRNGHEHWKFIEGEVYTVGVDSAGDKGFIDGVGVVAPANYENTFMFELIGEEPSDKITSDYPDYDFKINLEGMSDVEKGLAKDWLIEAVRSRDGETRHSMGNLNVDTKFFGVVTDYENTTIGVGYTQKTDFFYNHWKLPEIKLEFSTPTITGFSVDNSKKVLQLEEELATIRLQLKEKEAELESLK